MFDYKYEMHTHSKACSACASSSSEDIVRKAKECGYAGVFFTNHFYFGNSAIDRSLPWADFVDAYYADYLAAKKVGDSIGVDVFFGIEEAYKGGKEVLIYGIDPKVLANENGFPRFSLKEMSDFVRKNGGLFAAAHPFRNRSYIKNPDEAPDPSFFDAIEVHNQFNDKDGIENKKAHDFAKWNQLIMISGGDIHNVSSFGNTGLAFPYRIESFEMLKDALYTKQYKLIINGELHDPD